MLSIRTSAGRAVRSAIFAPLVLALSAGTLLAQWSGAISKEEYIRRMEAGLAATRSLMDRQTQHPLEFSANLFFAHEAVIEHIPLDVLKKEVEAFRELGLSRVDINMGLFPWQDNRRDMIEKYDSLIQLIRQNGLRLVINPQYSPTYHRITSFDEWKKASLPVYDQIARRYQPDIMIVAHEPTTMASRMGTKVSPAEWRDYAREAVRVVKNASPRTRCGAGGLYTEKAYFQEFLSLDEIDVLTLDIYNLASLRAYNQMIEMAKQKGKPVYIEETWRPPYYTPRQRGQSLEALSALGIGNSAFGDVDVQWLQTMVQYASVWGLEAVTPFWTQTFFRYVTDGGDALTPQYNEAVEQAINSGGRTGTFYAYQRLARQLSPSPKKIQ